jgi:hypothetical protein
MDNAEGYKKAIKMPLAINHSYAFFMAEAK